MALGTDIGGLIKYVRGGEWRLRFDAVMTEHVGAMLPRFKAETFEDLVRVIGPLSGMALWGCVFEDLVTRRFDDGEERGRVVDFYLKRRGWKEKLLTKGYLTSLAESVPTVYELTAVAPGQSMHVRDCLRSGTDPVQVHEKTASLGVTIGDRVCGRVAIAHKKPVFAGGLLPYSPEAVRFVEEALVAAAGPAPYDDETLRRSAPLFTQAWLKAKHAEILEQGESILPESNPDQAERIRAILADAGT